VYFWVLSALARRRWLVTAGLCAGVISCTEARPSDDVATLTQSIVGGEASGADQDGVVLLRAVLDDGSDLLCSASLVGPNLILTARHCVSYLSEGQFSCSVRGEPIDNPTGGGRLGLHLPAASLEIYGGKTPRKMPLAHGQQVLSTLSPTVCHNDLAFVVLDRALDLPIVPLRLGQPAQPHEAAVLVGYGLDSTQQVIDYRSQAREQKRDLEILAVGPDSVEDGVTTVSPRTLILQGPSGCVGDSGGPLLAQATGAILGVYSLLQGEDCAAQNIRHQLTHVPPFQTLIDEAFTAAGCEPLPEVDSDAGTDAGMNAAAGAPPADPASEAGATSEPSGAAGAAGATSTTVAEPVPSHSSSCTFAQPRPGARDATCLFALLASVAVFRRRQRRAPG
jgi:Trypsin